MSGSLDKLERLRGILDPDPLAIHRERCLREVDKDSPCTECFSSCPHEAIELSPYPIIDPDKCRGCGVCVSTCPTGALEATGVSLGRTVELIGDMLESTDVTDVAFVCRLNREHQVEGEALVILPCIGRVSHTLLLAAVARGARGVRIDTTSCVDCEQGVKEEWIRGEADFAAAMLEGAGMPIRISVGPQEGPESGPHASSDGIRSDQISRRGFLASLLKETASSALVLTGRALAEEGGPEGERHAPQGRVVLAEALFRLEEMGAEGITQLSGLIVLPSIGSGCDGCEDCVRFCPTGALSVDTDENGTGIVLQAGRCTGCGTCEHLCLEGAISMAPPTGRVAPDSKSVLARYGRAKCSRCGEEFTPVADEEVCRFCDKRRAIFGL